jgi:hypothetical protein
MTTPVPPTSQIPVAFGGIHVARQTGDCPDLRVNEDGTVPFAALYSSHSPLATSHLTRSGGVD